MSRFRIAPRARQDLKDIYGFIAQNNVIAAVGLIDKFYNKFLLLSERPLLGQACDPLGAGYRFFSVANYVVVYCPLEMEIEIIRVFHGAQNFENPT